MVLLLLPMPGDGPWYRGRSMRYWFPRWEPSRGDWEEARTTPLRQAGPEALPLLIAGVEASDHRFDLEFDRWVERLPVPLRAGLPTRFPASATNRRAQEILPAWLRGSTANQRAFTRAFGRLPAAVREASARWWQPGVHDPEIVGPHLESVAASDPDDAVVVAASVAWLAFGKVRPDALETVVRRLEAVPAGAWTDGRWPDHGEVVQRLAPMGIRAAVAEPWLRGWLATGAPPMKASAALALPFLAPERHRPADVLRTVLPEIGPEGVRLFWNLRVVGAEEHRSLRREFLAVLGPVFLTDDAGGWRSRWTNDARRLERGWMRPSSFSDLRLTGLSLLRGLGRDSLPQAALLIPLLRSGDARVAFEAARCVAQLGPVLPATVPQLLPALTNETTAAPLVLLLAAYGPEAEAAVPVLESLARGDAPIAGRGEGPAGRDLLGRQGVPMTPRGRVQPGYVLRSSNVTVAYRLAGSVGLTEAWPALPGVPGPAGTNARVTVAELAAEALRRIRADAGPSTRSGTAPSEGGSTERGTAP